MDNDTSIDRIGKCSLLLSNDTIVQEFSQLQWQRQYLLGSLFYDVEGPLSQLNKLYHLEGVIWIRTFGT